MVAFVSLVALVFILSSVSQTNTQAATAENQVKTLTQEKANLETQAKELSVALGQDELLQLNAAHSLVDRKRFSWTRLFSDLEGALPGSVRVTRIAVRDVATRGDRTLADLDLTVIGKNPDDVTRMITDMDKGGVFRAEVVAENLQKGRGETGTEWTLRVQYSPRPGSPISTGKEASVAKQLTATNLASAEVQR
jgi:Tfp pilus assembly protein PilN